MITIKIVCLKKSSWLSCVGIKATSLCVNFEFARPSLCAVLLLPSFAKGVNVPKGLSEISLSLIPLED
ncbi:hypothetical protein PP707_07125 [Acetobacter pasteurianus]|nr:hypothetical protein [Acetobacter pasteurianus]